MEWVRQARSRKRSEAEDPNVVTVVPVVVAEGSIDDGVSRNVVAFPLVDGKTRANIVDAGLKVENIPSIAIEVDAGKVGSSGLNKLNSLIQGMRPILKRRVAKDGEGVNGRPLVAIAGMLTVHLSVNIHRDLRWIADGNEHFATDHRRGWDR